MLMLSRRRSLPVLYYYCYCSSSSSSSISSRAAAFSLSFSCSRNMSSSSGKTPSISATALSATEIATSRILGKTLVSVPDAIGLHNDNDNSSNVKFLDGTWWLQKDRDGRQEFQDGPRISGARYLDIDEISTKTTPLDKSLPHMMPSKELHAAAMDASGIHHTDHVIVYGREDCQFVTRVYAQMRTMGHPKDLCHLLDGSLEEWIEAGGPTEDEGSPPKHPSIDAEIAATAATTTTTNTTPSYEATGPHNIITMEELRALIDDGKTMGEHPEALVVDARPKGRFDGVVPEPRPGLRGGHMPGARNLPITELLMEDNKVRFRPKEELKQIFKSAGISFPLAASASGSSSTTSKIVSSCGSGVTACAFFAALDILDEDSSNVYLYDGAWVEWGGQSDTPVVKD